MIRAIPYLFFFSLLLFGTQANAQQFKDYVKAADKAYNNKNFYEALVFYDEALQMYDKRTDVTFRYAESARMFNSFSIAEEAYTKVLDSEESGVYPLATYWLGTIKKQLGKYEEAKILFEHYLASPGAFENYAAIARSHIEDCVWAIQVVTQPAENIQISQLSGEINTEYSDFGPIEMGDTLYYSSYRFENSSDEFDPPRQLTKVLNSIAGSKGRKLSGGVNDKSKHTAHTTFNKDGSRMYYTLCDYTTATEIKCQIHYRDKVSNSRWSKPVKLPDWINNPEYTNTQPNIGYDESRGKEILYFVSDRTGGKGGLDIWYSYVEPNGEFTRPSNLRDINSKRDDIAPFYHYKTKTLYFSSNGYANLGGYDIFKSEKKEGAWAEPSNLGYPINSSLNDIDFSLNELGTKAYLSSNRPGAAYIEKEKEACCNDIYKVDIMPTMLDLMALVFNQSTEEALLCATVSVEPFEGGEPEFIYNAESNDFEFTIQPDQKYRVIARKEGFRPDTLIMDSFDAVSPIEQKLYLDEIPPEAPKVLLEALTFDTDKNSLRSAFIEITDLTTDEKSFKRNPISNNYDFELEAGKEYMLVAKKEGYFPDTTIVNVMDIKLSTTLREKMFLEKIPLPPAATPITKLDLDDYLPMPLFFDNDQPDSRTRRTTTRKTYKQAYSAYYGRKETFITEFSRNLEGEERTNSAYAINDFFEDEVRNGYESLDGFTNHLLRFLEQGNSAEILIKGFASPRAKSDYNKTLTKRRISSVRNHFRDWGNGALSQYLNTRQLVITERPFGEDNANVKVSDDIKDKRSSIYSVSASRERRVEILEVKTN